MKNISCIVLSIILIFTLCSCVNTAGPTPYGKWRNSAISLTLDINPNERYYGLYIGEYCYSGEQLQVLVGFSNHSDEFGIYSMDALNLEANVFTDDLSRYFRGTFKIKDGKMYYKLKPHWQELTGIKDTIIFEKIEEYEVN